MPRATSCLLPREFDTTRRLFARRLPIECAVEYVERRILEIRGAKVMIDSDLVELYGVETRALNQAVRRNPGSVPRGFRL
jgi:hypothetical protein